VDGKYRLESVLGEGGMGIVFLARDMNTEMQVVVKAIRAEMAHDQGLKERIRAEGRALAHIDHPSVVRLNAVVIEHRELYLVMQYIEGQSLDRLIERYTQQQRPFPLDEALTIFRQIVAGVGAAHQEGIMHRDLKPANVLIRARDGAVKVTDFGIAKLEDDAKAGRGQTKGIIGSLWYMAPEQVTGRRDLDKRVDIYSLGILLFELLTGRVPFDAASDYDIMRMHVDAPLPSVSAQRSDIPPAVDALLARACAKDREGRFHSCEEMLAALDALLAPPASRLSLPPAAAGLPGASTPSLVPPAPAPLPRASTPPKAPPAPLASDPARAATEDSLSIHQQAPPPPSRRGLWAALGLGAAGLVAAGAYVVGFTDLLGAPLLGATPTASGLRTASAAPRPSAAPAASASPLARLAAMQGPWVSDSNRHYDAVQVDDTLEFQVRNPAEFDRQNYQVGEARFTLKLVPGKESFDVEDKLRPQSPEGTSYAPSSRGSCAELWKDVNNVPLSAHLDGKKLSVDLAKVTPEAKHFIVKGKEVVGCNRLKSAVTDRTESTLTREAPPATPTPSAATHRP
jgi:serine/threonine-protein kinase